MAASATLHCLTGCSIGETIGLLIGTHQGWSNLATTVLSISLAFVFGYSLSAMPLLRSGIAIAAALQLVLAADTLSILTMEVVDNLVMVVIPGAMNAGLTNVLFWVSMTLSLLIAYAAAYPVNRHLLARGKGHAISHSAQMEQAGDGGHGDHSMGAGPVVLATGIAGFLLGGFVVALSTTLSG